MKYSEHLEIRKKDLVGNTKKVGELIEVEAMRLLYKDLRQAALLARAVSETARGNPGVSVEEVISIHALINAYYRNGYVALVEQGLVVEAPVPGAEMPSKAPPESN